MAAFIEHHPISAYMMYLNNSRTCANAIDTLLLSIEAGHTSCPNQTAPFLHRY
ncbi:MAG: hypothetical protein NTW29_19270 [Bacteroidetes bacterium]|nr:hypothetical protein [Bacteroidota bacterium]